MKAAKQRQIVLSSHRVNYDVFVSKAARQIRVRVGPGGVAVTQPANVGEDDVSAFLRRNENWVLAQLDRVAGLRSLRRPALRQLGQVLYRGNPTPVRVEFVDTKARGLENWLRREARAAIADYIPTVTSHIGQQPGRVYVMGQRTKWGNCSSRRNLSFNWRLILAPDFLLRYLVAHEVVHLAVPDHSAKFWLTVQSVCPETERAKQWLSRHHAQLTVDLAAVLQPTCSARKEKSP